MDASGSFNHGVPAAGPALARPLQPSLFDHLAAPRWTALATATLIAFVAIGLATERGTPNSIAESGPRESGPPALHERGDSLRVIGRGAGFALELGLGLELRLEGGRP